MALFRALRHPPFALLLFGQTLSRLGDFVFQLALAWWVLQKTGSALTMSGVLAAGLVPTLIFILLGGVAVDRFSRVGILLISDFGRGVVMLTITLLAASNYLDVWMIYVLSLLFSFADAFFQPAFVAIVPQITPADDLPSANALSSLSLQLGRVLGPALGGLLMGLGNALLPGWGITFAFGVNAISFFVSGVLLLPLLGKYGARPTPPADDTQAAAQFSLQKNLLAGWQVVVQQPILWVSILLFAFINVTLVGPFGVAMPFLVKDFMRGDEALLGTLLSIFPIGYVAAGMVLGNLRQMRRRGLWLYVGSAVAGLGLAVLGLPVPFWVVVIAALLNGAALEAGGQAWMSILQNVVPPDKLGRVVSIDTLGSYLLLPLGYALAGLLVEKIGPAQTFFTFGLLCAAGSVLPLLWRPVQQFD